jgi:hypothetical protein
VSDEVGSVSKEAAVAYFKVLSQNILGRADGDPALLHAVPECRPGTLTTILIPQHSVFPCTLEYLFCDSCNSRWD